MTPLEIREVCERQATVDLRFALDACGIGEANGYRLAKYRPHELPFKVLRVGRVYKVPTAGLTAALGLSSADDAEAPLTA